MSDKLFYLTGIVVSAFIFVSIFSRKPRSKTTRTLMLLAADAGFIISQLLYHPQKESKLFLLVSIFGAMNILAIRKILMGENPDQETLNAWHDDPANWKAGIFHFNLKDKRIFPPNRLEAFGWTTNFGNPYSILSLGLLMLFILLIINIFH